MKMGLRMEITPVELKISLVLKALSRAEEGTKSQVDQFLDCFEGP
jgi:hypothetical protein